MSDWGARLVRLAQRTLPSENGVTPVMRRNGNSRYVSEVPVVTPVTPVTPSAGSFPREGKIGGVTDCVTLPDQAVERAAIMEIDGGLPRQIAVALARLEATLPVEMIDTLAQFADEWGGTFLDDIGSELSKRRDSVERRCRQCGKDIADDVRYDGRHPRADAQYCGPACRQRAYRSRVTTGAPKCKPKNNGNGTSLRLGQQTRQRAITDARSTWAKEPPT
jgi:hypothetical protein